MRKLLVANRSEIAIRVFRAATELGLGTVAVYTYEDRFSLHRFKADESYLIGPAEGGEPVKGYLNIAGIIAVAKEHGVDAIHPGYGFLSENADLAQACIDDGITFVGPTPELLETFGDKTAAKKLADQDRRPHRPRHRGRADRSRRRSRPRPSEIGYPLIIKASFGGGGRGMRVVNKRRRTHADRLEEAQREAGAAFGRAEVFLERYIARAKHIEVQILGDTHGNLVHLWERDCSVQRRHQKVVEVAPSINLPLELREEICEAAKRLCAGGELPQRRHGRIPARPGPRRVLLHRGQPAHPGRAHGHGSRHRHRHRQEPDPRRPGVQAARRRRSTSRSRTRSRPAAYAIQCRITTEDPENHFIPDYGRLTTYRSAAGFGIRLDGGTRLRRRGHHALLRFAAGEGHRLGQHVRGERSSRMDRALREFRVRGVKTNIPFLENLILHPTFMKGEATTTFIDNTPELFRFRPSRDRATKILSYLGDVIVNGRPDVKGKVDPKRRAARRRSSPSIRSARRRRRASRHKLLELGPEKFCRVGPQAEAAAVHRHDDPRRAPVAAGDARADVRPARSRRRRRPPHAGPVQPGDVGRGDVRHRHAVPAGRPVGPARPASRQRIPNILFQMLLRASNAVGYTNYPDNVVREFVKAVGRARHRRLPHLRLAQLDREHEGGDRGGAREDRRALRGRHLLHRRHPRPQARRSTA